MQSITTEFKFSAAHRIEGHAKCGRMHGHNYRVLVTISSQQEVDDMGFIVDFGIVKEIVNPIIDSMDHRYIVSRANTVAECPYLYNTENSSHEDDICYIPINQTSAELLATWLKDTIQMAFIRKEYQVIIAEVIVWETDKNYAQA